MPLAKKSVANRCFRLIMLPRGGRWVRSIGQNKNNIRNTNKEKVAMKSIAELGIDLFARDLPSMDEIKTLSETVHCSESNQIAFSKQVEANMARQSQLRSRHIKHNPGKSRHISACIKL